MGLWYPNGSSFGLIAFSDADHAGCIDTHKSTSRGIQFLGDKLVSWMSKKQDCTTMSSAEAEYVALSASCAQVMWMRTQLQDYGLNYNKISLYCDSQSAIAISCNPVQHFRTKHIHTRLQLRPERQRRVYASVRLYLALEEKSSNVQTTVLQPHSSRVKFTTTCSCSNYKGILKHQDSRIKKAQVLKTKTSANSDIKDPSSKKLQGRFLASFQDDAKYEHVGTKTQDRKVAKTIKTER
nr:uncharacterized mitochondrial protein AtMg00810-like [Tanacetum cinerariifolium]